MSEYAVLAVLSWRALRKPRKEDDRGWTFRHAIGAFLIAATYAMTDEFHQTFVPSRQGQFTDVLFDSSGALLGLAAIWIFGRWKRMW